MILPGVDRNVMPLQLEHSFGSPFFGIGTMMPSLHSLGTLPAFHTLLHKFVSDFTIASPPYLSSSGFITSFPAAPPFLRLLSAFRTSSSLIIISVYFELFGFLLPLHFSWACCRLWAV